MKSNWTSWLTWLLVVALALLLAIVAPRDTHVIGRLPGAVALKLDQAAAGMSAREQRMLALITFHRDQRRDVESWISGLKLRHDRSIAWIRMPVVDDPGNARARSAAEGRLMARYASAPERFNLLPAFTDRDAFVRSAGLPDSRRAYVLVINRDGEVLARVAGAFDEAKAEVVRENL